MNATEANLTSNGGVSSTVNERHFDRLVKANECIYIHCSYSKQVLHDLYFCS